MKTQSKKRKGAVSESAFKLIFLLSALFSIIAVIAISVFLLIEGIPALSKIGLFKFLTGKEWMPAADVYGILPMIVGSLYATAGALIIGGILGIFTAVFLAKFCPPKLKTALSQVINLLAGIPSVVFGFFGLAVISPFLGQFSANGSGLGILTVSIVLGIMILPTVVSLSKTSIEAVDQSYFEGAIALGATKERAVFRVIVPAAKSGIFAAVILGIGRALGETMAVAMVSGGRAVFPENLLTSFRTMTGNIVMEMGYANGLHLGALIATGVVLFVFVLIINIAFNIIKNAEGGKDKKSLLVFLIKTVLTGGLIVTVRRRKLKDKSAGFKTKWFVAEKTYLCVFTKRTMIVIRKKKSLKMSAKEKSSGSIIESVVYQGGAPSAKASSFSVKAGKALPAIGKCVSLASTALAVASLIAIVFFILFKGLPHISLQLLFGEYVYGGANSIFPAMLTTLMLIAVSSVIAFPLGIFTAIFLVEYTKKGSRSVKFIRLAVETLGGIPSIIYGLFGMIFFCGILGLGTSIIAGCLTVSLMIIPTTVRSVEESLKSVPDTFRAGSYALGAGKLRTIYKIIIPSALPGILAAVILGVGRMMGESAPVVFTSGSTIVPAPKSYKSTGPTLAVALYALAREGLHMDEAYATACVLIVLVLALNILSTLLVSRFQKKLAGAKT